MTSTQEDFKHRFATVIIDLQTHGPEDKEALWLIGSLANRLIAEARQNSWPGLKSALSRDAYDRLLDTFTREGNALLARGNRKAAYAVQVISYSMIASKMTDDLVVAGNELMDEFIAYSVNFHNRQAPRAKAH